MNGKPTISMLRRLGATILGLAACLCQASCTTAQDPPIELVAVDQEALNERIAKHPGSIILVDFWATWCEPCREKFPHTVEMARQYKDQGLIVWSLSMDDQSDKEEVTKFLRSQKAPFEHLIRSEGIGEAFEDFNLDAVPAFRVYGPDGQLLKTFTDEDPEVIEAFVRDQLRQLK
jgi:thiol-disulfide isomerase/thioredoxin